jgi:signal peptidase I
VELAITIAIAWMLVETWCIEGLVVPVWVPSGSMAETLVGLHREVTCVDCGYQFVCGTDLRPLSYHAVCPNCGYSGNDLSQRPDVDGDRLLIDKSAFLLRRPRRWEVVAFRHPSHAEMICVKRVVGLPGESIEIRHGDLYVDGRVQRKTLAQQRVMSVLVYDANHPVARASDLPPCWQSERDDSGWTVKEGRFTHAAQTRTGTVDWCVFHHWQRGDHSGGPVRETPIRDDFGYNQGGLRGAPNVQAVADLRLAFRLLRASGQGRLLVRAMDGDRPILVRLDPSAKRYEVLSGTASSPRCSGTLPAIAGAGSHQIEVSLVDRQFLLAVDDHTLTAFPLELPGHRPPATTGPLAIGADGLELQLGDVRVYRDIYYTEASGGAAHWALDRPVRLGGDEYFMLGDNSPISDDSRTWPQGPCVPAKLLFGKPLLVHFPARQVDLWGWRFQLPDLSKIRYIR